MDESLEYQQDMKKSDNEASKWQIGAPSALSFESGESDFIYSPQDQHVQYIPEKDVRSVRRTIPASWHEVLTYYRCYSSATSKSPVLSMQFIRFNKFVWYYLFNAVFKSLPHTYVYMFLASYVPDQHFFLSKMVPITYGFTFVYILSGFFDVLFYMESIRTLLDYTLMSIKYKNPWNRCESTEGVFVDEINATMTCYNLYDVGKKMVAQTAPVTNTGFCYRDSYGECFNVAHIVYFYNRSLVLVEPFVPNTGIALIVIYYVVLWLIVTLLSYNLLYRRWVWKTLNVTQWLVNVIYIIVFCHLSLDHFVNEKSNVSLKSAHSYENFRHLIETMDIDAVAETTTAPPIMHILPTRINRQVEPSKDSAVIVISNTFYFLFKGLLTYRIETYCRSIVRAPITILKLDTYCFYYLWTMYFSTIYLGELCTMIFFILHFIMELLCAMITYQCLLEAITCEWRKVKRIIVMGFLTALGLIVAYFADYNKLVISYLTCRWSATSLEILGIYFLYPLGRLIDDITFYSGITPTRLRRLNLKLVPFYYAIKFYTMIKTAAIIKLRQDHTVNYWILFFISLGVVYSVYKYIFKFKLSWVSLFRPKWNWGPPFAVRQIRKKYDSQTYIGSQAPRDLSRYMFYKAEAKSYTLDIRYDLARRTTNPNMDLRIENEVKKDV